MAAGQEAAGVRLLDAEQSLANSDLAVGGILGGDLFYEHVHFTFDGNYLLARCMLERGLRDVAATGRFPDARAGPLKRAMCGIAGADPLGRVPDGRRHAGDDVAAAVHRSVGPCRSPGFGGEAGGGTRPACVHAAGPCGGACGLRGGAGEDAGRLATSLPVWDSWRWPAVNPSWPPSTCRWFGRRCPGKLRVQRAGRGRAGLRADSMRRSPIFGRPLKSTPRSLWPTTILAPR